VSVNRHSGYSSQSFVSIWARVTEPWMGRQIGAWGVCPGRGDSTSSGRPCSVRSKESWFTKALVHERLYASALPQHDESRRESPSIPTRQNETESPFLRFSRIAEFAVQRHRAIAGSWTAIGVRSVLVVLLEGPRTARKLTMYPWRRITGG
jgi:hypothetical protein